MKRLFPFFFVFVTLLTSCSSGKKAMERGDYFDAVRKSVNRLKSDPDNSKAASVLDESYKLALSWSQEEMDRILSLNEPFKWEKAVGLMEQVNGLASEIRQSPSARKVIADPKVYTSELNMGREKAAEERYNAGLVRLEQNTRESAREAYHYFERAGQLVSGYRDVVQKKREAKDIATLSVILEAISVHTQKYQLSSEFFYDQVFEYLNNQFPSQSFVNFYSPKQAQDAGLQYPDMVLKLEFYDFVVGNSEHSEKEEEVKQQVKIESKDTTRVQYKTYVAKLKTFADKVISGGVLDVKIVEANGGKLLMSDRVPGSFTWVNEYAMFVGDKEALTKNQLEMTKNSVKPLPPGQDLFIEFTKPIYSQLTGKLYSFFKRYND